MKKKDVKMGLSVLLLAVLAAVYVVVGPDAIQSPEADLFVTQGRAGQDLTGLFQMHFIDVGQGDAVLLRTEEATILVDGGDQAAREELVTYLKQQGITHLDLMVGTHPHSDHIAGLVNVVQEFDIDRIFMPRAEATTEVYRSLLLAIQDKGMRITAPEAGAQYVFGDLVLEILGPNRDYSDLNNMSIVMRVTFGEVSLLLTGDMERDAEEDLLAAGHNPSAHILKVGHHGSRSSSSYALLEAVQPFVAVISCAEGNSYGHPHDEILDRLSLLQIEVLRTDQEGHIVLVTDGNRITKQG